MLVMHHCACVLSPCMDSQSPQIRTKELCINNHCPPDVVIITSSPHHRLRRSPAPMGADMWYRAC